MIVLIPFQSKQLEDSILGTSNSAVTQPVISARAAAAIIDHKNYIAEKAAAGILKPDMTVIIENDAPVRLRDPPSFCSLVNIEPATPNNSLSTFKLPPFSTLSVTLEFCYYSITNGTKKAENPAFNLSLCLDYLTGEHSATELEEKTSTKQSTVTRYYRK